MEGILDRVRGLTPAGAIALCALGLAGCSSGSDDDDAGGGVQSDPSSDGSPVTETPPTEGPGGETPTEGPGDETPTEGPGEETPTEGPGDETPTEGPGEETPTEGPGEETPTEGPGEETPTEGPGGETPTEGPGEETPTEGPGEETPTEGPGEETPTEGPGEETPTEGPGEETPTEGPGEETPTEGPGNETPEPGPSDAAISVEGYEAFLANLLDVLDGTRFAELHALADALLDADEARVTLVDTAFGPGETRTYDCSGGGRYVAVSTFSGAVGEIITATATDCVVAEGELDGSLFRSGNYVTSLEDFTLSRSSGAVETLVRSERTLGREPVNDVATGAGSFEVSYAADGVAIDASTELLFVDLSDTPSEGVEPLRFLALFEATVTAPWTGGQPLALETTEQFVAVPEEAHYTVGTLVARASDGSALTLEAANGDPGTFQVTVETQGTASAFTVPWTEETRLPRATVD